MAQGSVWVGWRGTARPPQVHFFNARIFNPHKGQHLMNNIVYIVGAVVIIIAILSFFGLR